MSCIFGDAAACVIGDASGCLAPKEAGLGFDPLTNLRIVGFDKQFQLTWDTYNLYPGETVRMTYRSLSPLSAQALAGKDGTPLTGRDGTALTGRAILGSTEIDGIEYGVLSTERDEGRLSSPLTLHQGEVYKVFVRLETETLASPFTVLWVYTDDLLALLLHDGQIVHYNQEIVVTDKL